MSGNLSQIQDRFPRRDIPSKCFRRLGIYREFPIDSPEVN
jgi:hypothetical protein